MDTTVRWYRNGDFEVISTAPIARSGSLLERFYDRDTQFLPEALHFESLSMTNIWALVCSLKMFWNRKSTFTVELLLDKRYSPRPSVSCTCTPRQRNHGQVGSRKLRGAQECALLSAGHVFFYQRTFKHITLSNDITIVTESFVHLRLCGEELLDQ